MAKVFGGGNAGNCGTGGILPSPKQQVTAARSVVSNPNVFKSGSTRNESLDPRDFYTRREVDKYLDEKADLSSVYTQNQLYTKSEIDNRFTNLNLSLYAQKTYVDSKVTEKGLEINTTLANNYYLKTQLYTKSEVDSLISSADLGDQYLSKAPTSLSDITISPGNSVLPISLLVKASNNSNTTQVQRWENSSGSHLASIFANGSVMLSNYVSIGENVNTDGVALNTNERRIEGVADPVNNLDAVNKTYMERFITTTIDDVLTDSDENYLIDALEY